MQTLCVYSNVCFLKHIIAHSWYLPRSCPQSHFCVREGASAYNAQFPPPISHFTPSLTILSLLLIIHWEENFHFCAPCHQRHGRKWDGATGSPLSLEWAPQCSYPNSQMQGPPRRRGWAAQPWSWALSKLLCTEFPFTGRQCPLQQPWAPEPVPPALQTLPLLLVPWRSDPTSATTHKDFSPNKHTELHTISSLEGVSRQGLLSPFRS